MSKTLITREQRAAVQDLWQQVIGLSTVDPDRSFADLSGTVTGLHVCKTLIRVTHAEPPMRGAFRGCGADGGERWYVRDERSKGYAQL